MGLSDARRAIGSLLMPTGAAAHTFGTATLTMQVLVDNASETVNLSFLSVQSASFPSTPE
jgi:hypothetical protein